jgi:hypothetical protein
MTRYRPRAVLLLFGVLRLTACQTWQSVGAVSPGRFIELDQPDRVRVTGGGVLCEHFGRHLDRRFVVRRLPPLPTDQTASLIRRRTADALPLLIDIVREMHRIPEETP